MSPLAALAATLLAAAPFKAEQPRVREGNEKLLSGDPAAALERYGEAEREAGKQAEIDFDRGNALHAQGRHAEAREAWKKALEEDRSGALASRALQNMGNALDAAGDQEGAARAFTDALTRDPANEDARYNLEVLQRRKASGKGKPRDEGQDGARKQPEKPEQDQGQQPQQGDQGKQPGPEPKGAAPKERQQGKERRAGDQQRQEPGTQDPSSATGDRKAGDDRDRAGARPEGLGRQDAERLLDALRARERNMPLGPAGRKDGRKREATRDW